MYHGRDQSCEAGRKFTCKCNRNGSIGESSCGDRQQPIEWRGDLLPSWVGAKGRQPDTGEKSVLVPLGNPRMQLMCLLPSRHLQSSRLLKHSGHLYPERTSILATARVEGGARDRPSRVLRTQTQEKVL